MLTRPVLIFVILAAWSIRQSESAFNQSACRDASVPSVAGIVVDDEAAPRNKWPWLVAMSTKTDKKTDEEFFCGGFLISERFVLTAAHCIQYKGDPKPRKPEDVNVYIGQLNLTDKAEPDAVKVTPDEFIVHTDWNVSDTRWDADIAIVKLSEDVTLSDSIQPVCLWTSQMQPEKANDGGMVVGWGQTENRMYSDVPQEVNILGLLITDCNEIEGLHDVISNSGLCVGGTGRGPCNSNSGGGFLTARGVQWFLRGIRSVSRPNAVNECDVNAPAVFTNIEKFITWIDQVLNGDEQLKCRFQWYNTVYYTCYLQNSFTRRDKRILQVSGSHLGGQTNADVRNLDSRGNSKIKFLPLSLGRLFPNLETYKVSESEVEEVSRKLFVDLPKLELLEISSSRLKVIPVDTFYDFADLEWIWLQKNQIGAIDSLTFIHNTKLKRIELQNNKITSLDSSTFRNNLDLEYIDFSHNLITTIGPELLRPLKKLHFVFFDGNKCVSKTWWGRDFLQKGNIRAIFASQCQ